MSTAYSFLRCVFYRFVQILRLIVILCVGKPIALAAEPNGAVFNGAMTGSFNVSSAGAAMYSIPIEVPPGIGGMTPQLALSYSSQSGNGLLGVGWSLSGLSSITRCPTTLAQDGLIDPVDLDSNDRYCLDGQRLIKVTNAGCSGGNEYRTEIDSFARICAYGSAGEGPAWFKVWTKAGQVMEYANTVDSRIEAQGVASVLVWAINRIEDAAGNYLDIAYFEDNAKGEYRVERIDYAGNAAQGMVPFHSVQFEYESRADVPAGHVAGKQIRISVRLSTIKVYAGYELVRDYRLKYGDGPRTGRSRIASLQRCDGSGASIQCQPESTLDWSAGATAFAGVIDTGRSNVGHLYAQPIDVNGDGLTDLAYCTSSTANWRLLISTGDGLKVPIDTGRLCTNFRYALPLDYDTDGKMDLLVPYANGRWYVLRSTGSGFAWIDTGIGESGYDNKPVVLDINGDGRDDLALVYNNAWYLRINNGNGFKGAVATSIASTNSEYRQKIDYDGDGRDDLLVPYANNRWYVLRSTGSTLKLVDTGRSSVGHDKDPQVMDVDGDGRQDLVVNGSSKLIYFNRGNVFSGPVSTGLGTQWSTTTFQIDYNGDGRMDLIMPGSPGGSAATYWHILQSTGTDFSVINTGIESTGYDNDPRPGDYNGDGFVDLALSYNSVWMLRLHTSGVADLLRSVSDGMGNQSKVTYKPLTDTSVYSQDVLSTYPMMGIRGPLHVVSRSEASDGVGGVITNTYTYSTARVDLHGRGFLGFAWVLRENQQTGIHTRTVYKQSFPYIGKIAAVTEYWLDSSGTDKRNIRELKNAWVNIQTYPGVHQPSLSYSRTVRFGFEGESDIVSTEDMDAVEYDNYGNPGRMVITLSGGGEQYTKTTVNVYENDVTQWRLGRLTRSTVTSEAPGGVGTRTTVFEYHPVTSLLSAEIIEPDDPQLMLRTEYGYDAYGNRTSVTVRDSGGNDHPIAVSTSTTQYDYGLLGVNGTYSITNVNAKGHVETQVVDARFGKPLSLTGPNGLTTQWRYDSSGRQLDEIRADGTETHVSRVWCDSSCAGVTHAAYKATTQSSGSAPVTVYYDSFGRELRKRTASLNDRVVFTDIEYNNLGKIARASIPYFASTSPQWADFQYDAIGRIWKETRPDGGVIETTYHGLSTLVRRYSVNDAYDQIVNRITDVEGKLVRMIDEGRRVTRYEYDSFGNLVRVIDPANNATVMVYDQRGRKISMDDPDMGHWEYQYDALGRLRWQTDARQQVMTMDYDILGRMIRRVEPEGVSSWSYDKHGSKAIGKLWKVTGPNGYNETVNYDALGRPVQTSYVLNGTSFTTGVCYDGLGRLDILTYPDGFRLRHGYNALGYMDKIGNADNADEVYWSAQEMSPDGQISSENLGNGLQTVRSIDPQSGRMTYLGTYAGSNNVQMLTYRYDSLGNLKYREDSIQNLSESFGYDNYNRLTDAEISGVGVKTWSYDDLGNIESKDGYTDYDYGPTGGAKPHAVKTARGSTYSYDANGNMESGGGRVITWNSANLPTRIVKGNAIAEFSYGPGRSYYKQVNVFGRITTTTLYVGKLYEHASANGVSTRRSYIAAGGRVVAIREVVNGAATLKYLHQDHLGSTDVITGDTGQVLQRQSFDAYGTRRVANSWRDPVAMITSLYSTRGYTGHEQLDNVGLIHMNGRVYDPQLGRFISADPHVQTPGNAQSLNRFAYVWNNPLARTDPSGYFLDAIGDWLNDNVWEPIGDAVGVDKDDFARYGIPLTAIVMAPYAGFYVGTTYGLSTATGYAVSGFTAGLIAGGGDLQSGLIGAATALGFYAVGSFGQTYDWGAGQTAFAQGVLGGASSAVSGGRFEHGLLSGGFTSLASPVIGAVPGDWVGRTIAAAVVGGVSAELGGGKFANGAKTLGFLRLFGEFADYAGRVTDRYKRMACNSGGRVCVVDERGVLRTDGARDVDFSLNQDESGNWLTRSGMAYEGSSSHVYEDGRLIRYFVTDVSKIHDYFNSWNYSRDTGFYMSRGAVFDSAFQIYSFSGMPVAGVATAVGYAGNRPFEEQVLYYNISRSP